MPKKDIPSTIADKVIGAIKKEATSLVKSQVKSVAKKQIGKFFDKLFSKTDEEIKAEAEALLGYPTLHFENKNGKLEFKSSPVFIHEWLTNNPEIKDKIVRDEENNKVYFENHILESNSAIKHDLINKLVGATKVKSTAINSHFEGALKLLETSDFTASQFKKVFAGWDPNQQFSMIDSWMEGCFKGGMTTDPALAKRIFRKWIVGTARRAISPGSVLEGALTFKGPPAVGKTQFFRQLLPAPFSHRTGEIYCDISNARQMTESIVGKTIATFDELSALKGEHVIESFKMLLTAQFVDVRLAWAREPRRYDLRQGFGATTNEQKFIPDANVSRRLWVVELDGSNTLDFDFLKNNRFKLWQEAVFCAQRGDVVYLSSEDQKLIEENNKQYLINI